MRALNIGRAGTLRSVAYFFCISILLNCTPSAKVSAKSIEKTLVFENKVTLKVEMAQTLEERQKGLMHRTSLRKDRGMLFVFERPHFLSFWMKNTYIPLEIGFFDKGRTLVNIEAMVPQARGPIAKQNLKSYQSTKPCIYGLEVNPGWFKKNNIIPGAKFKIQ